MRHTPGPWVTRESDDYFEQGYTTAIDAGEWTQLATVHSAGGVQDPEGTANARLIAAAPELFWALRGILEIGKRDMSNPKYDGYFDGARQALAKAEGTK